MSSIIKLANCEFPMTIPCMLIIRWFVCVLFILYVNSLLQLL